jgi:hypothetical protein
MRRRCRWLALFQIALLCLLASPAHSEEPLPVRKIGIGWAKALPQLSFNVRDMLRSQVREKLRSGLPQTIVTRIYVYNAEAKEPFAVAPLACRYTYDLWEDRYRVEYRLSSGWQLLMLKNLNENALPCITVWSLSVGVSHLYQTHRGQSIYFRIVTDFNPMSDKERAQVQRWLARGSVGRGNESDAFFGSIVGFFLARRVIKAERSVQFISQTVSVP